MAAFGIFEHASVFGKTEQDLQLYMEAAALQAQLAAKEAELVLMERRAVRAELALSECRQREAEQARARGGTGV